MARIRYIKPEFFDDPDIGKLSPMARVVFIGLWTQADRAGRMEDCAPRLKARLLPYDDVDIEPILAELDRAGMVIRYAVDGRNYLHIRSFEKHQRPHVKEPASAIPEPAGKKRVRPRKNPARTGNARSRTLENGDGEWGMGTGNGDGDSSATPRVPEPPAVLTFPTVGKPQRWPLTDEQIAEWREAYPHLEVLGECRKALAWVQANQPKTARGMPAFLVRWLNKAADRGGGGSKPTATVERWSDWAKEGSA